MAKRKRTPSEQLKYERARALRILARYGITMPEYDAIKEVQDGVCFLCQRAKGISAPLQVDHDHGIDEPREAVRGLLCGRCNNRLGWAEARLDRIIAYLNDPPARKVLR